jgi:hypothetical protein
MDELVWNDLTSAEQQAIALLGTEMSVAICDKLALRTLRRAGLVRGARLTPKGKQLRRDAILQTLAA